MLYHFKITRSEQDTQVIFPEVVLTDYNVMIDGGNTFDQPIKNDLRTYEKIQKITTGPGDDYMTSFLLDYPYFKNTVTW